VLTVLLIPVFRVERFNQMIILHQAFLPLSNIYFIMCFVFLASLQVLLKVELNNRFLRQFVVS